MSSSSQFLKLQPQQTTRIVWKDRDTHSNADEYFVYVIVNEYTNWKKTKDTTIPLINVLDKWEVFILRGDVKGEPSHPSKGELESAFGSSALDVVIPTILREGTMQGQDKRGMKQHGVISSAGTSTVGTAH